MQRTLKFIKYLPRFGWDPVVVTVGQTKEQPLDYTLLRDIPEETTIIRVDDSYLLSAGIIKQIVGLLADVINDKAVMNEYALGLLRCLKDDGLTRQLLPRLICMPDRFILWVNQMINQLAGRLDLRDIDLIYSTGGPYSNHLGGYRLKKMLSKPWVADFRDEWTNNPYANYDQSSLGYRMHFALEDSMVNYADRVIANTPFAVQNYRRRFHLPDRRVVSITNGYDEADFANINISSARNDHFILLHNGLCYGIRTPLPVFDALQQLIAKKLVDGNRVKLIFPALSEQWLRAADAAGLRENVVVTPSLSHDCSLRLAAKSDALLLIVGPGEKNKAMIPAKLFEYLRLNKPILSLSPQGGLVDQIITKSSRGYNVDFEDLSGIEDALLALYNNWLNRSAPALHTDDYVRQFEREKLTGLLAAIFDSLISNV